MADPNDLTLDIKEPQILRRYPNDANAFYWHHRVLLCKVSPGIWIGLTPDADLERIDLHAVEHIPLERRAPFPNAQAPYTYAFDEINRADLERRKRRAAGMASLFDDVPMEDLETFEWLVSDVSHADFGKAVSEQELAAGVTMGDAAVIHRDDQEVFARRISSTQKSKWLETMDSARGDIRLLGDHRDAQNRRFLDFKTALTLMKESKMEDWPLQGPRVTLEYLRSIRSGPGDLPTYHLTWMKSSGVNQHSMICHDHRVLCNVLRAALEIDQLDIANSLAFELICRRLVQLETATARSPLNPDFSGLEMVLEDQVGPGGEAVTTTFSTWLSTKLKEKASIAKQTRLYKEEFRGASSSDGAYGTRSAEDKGKGKGGRAKAKAKGKAGSQKGGAGQED